MSKQIKQMQMDVLAASFKDVRNMVLLSASGIDVQSENKMRLDLRKKNIRLLMTKNSLLRRVFGGMGLSLPDETWVGSTIVAWGAESVKDLSKAIETHLRTDKIKDKLKVKTAVAEGQPLPFAQALTMPTRKEAIGEVIAAALGPAGSIAAALTSPGAELASQIQTIADKKPEETAAA